MLGDYQPTPARSTTLLTFATLIAFWALAQGGLATLGGGPVLDADLAGPDSYMRLVRVSELLSGGAWFDSTITRANAPYGDVLHWTRPFDVLLLVLALPLSAAMEAERALHLSGVVISPLLQLATAFLLIWALRPMIRRETWFLPAIAFLLQPGAVAYSTLGRADHHSLMFLVFVVIAGFMLRALLDPRETRPALFAGAAAGFGIWLSVEFLLAVAICLIALGLPWLFGERGRASQNRWFAMGISGVLLLALVVERPLGQLFDPSYDRVSNVQYLLCAGTLVLWCAIEALEAHGSMTSRFAGRAAIAGAGAGAVALLLTLAYPPFFAGPMVEIDPRIAPIWLDRVNEMLPLTPHDSQSFGKLVLYLGGLILIAWPFLRRLFEVRGTEQFFAYLFIGLCCLLFTLMALRHLRFTGYAEIGFVLAFAVVLDHVLRVTGSIGNDLLRGAFRGAFIVAMLIAPILIGATLMTKDARAGEAKTAPAEGCDVRQVAGYLENDPRWAASPRTVLAFMDIGPELLYRTRHRVVGTPYHRNGNGIVDGHRLLAGSDLVAVRPLFEERRIDLVLICGSSSERTFYAPDDGEDNLYLRLARGVTPSWLAAVELPEALGDEVLLYRVLR